jgi:hypothetical protein
VTLGYYCDPTFARPGFDNLAAINVDRDSTDNIVRVALNYQFH